MKETRESLTEKVAALEQHVVGTIHEATSAVHDTVSHMKQSVSQVSENVKQSVSQVSENVKATFDVAEQVRRRPWVMVGGATAAGFLAGFMIGGGQTTGGNRSRRGEYRSSWAADDVSDGTRSTMRSAVGATAAASGVGSLFDELFSMARRELRTIGEQALNKLSASIKQSLNQGIETLAQNTGNLVGSGFGMMGEQHGYEEDENEGAGRGRNGRGMNLNRS